MEGWIKIDRRIRNHWLWDNPRHLKWWLDLLLMAAWKDTEIAVGSKVVTLRRGQLAVSVRELCTRWTYTGDDQIRHTPSPKTVIRYLETLVGSNMVTKTSKNMPNRVTLITICNYDRYQSFEGMSGNAGGNTPGNTLGNTLGNTIRRNKEIVDEVNGARVCVHTHEGDTPLAETPALAGTTSPTDLAAAAAAAAQNSDFLAQYFDPSRLASLEGRTKHLHSIDPAIRTIEDFRCLARACLDEWELRCEPPKPNFREWASHLIRHVERKARANRDDRDRQNQSQNQKQSTNADTNQHLAPPSFREARARGDDEFARFAASKIPGLL